jgi:hypothetical protein
MSADFRVHAAISAFMLKGDANPMRIGGLVSSAKLDSQSERILQEGLDFKQFMDRGWYNDNHGQATTDNVGYPTAAKHVRKGQRLPNGQRAKRAGWWTEGYLLNTERGRKLFDMAKALETTPRSLGFSIEGKVVERDPTSPHVIKRARVRNVAITACPVNTDTELALLTKSLQAGSSVASPGASAGEGFPLRTEELGTALADEEMPQWFKAYIEAEEAAKGAVSKAEGDGTDPVVVDEFADLGRWSRAAKASMEAHDASLAKAGPSLTRLEACEIVRERFPAMSPAKVEAIVDHVESRRSS